MKSFLKLLLYVSLFVLLNFSYATVKNVPQPYPAIQLAINASQNGDTVSVWTEQGGSIPRTYQENINFAGKNILVVNRSYITSIPNYPPNSSYIVIDGQQNGSVVTFNSDETHDAILKGFTIQHGHADNWGGGIFTDSASPTIANNIIKNNRSEFAGGGIACGTYRRIIRCPIISNNLIIGNYAEYFGGGINVEADTTKIMNNIIIHDTCNVGHGGGGIRLSKCGLGTAIRSNIIDTNYSRGFAGGGGILFEDCDRVMVRSNTIRRNVSDFNPPLSYGWGIYCYYSAQIVLPDLGTSSDPGFNVIMDNYAKDLYQNVPTLTLQAEGNYWGTLDIDTLRVHTGQEAGGQDVDFDPIAASDRVASVSYNSACSTDVIVTGDLTINQNVTLNVASGKTFKFTTTADTNTGNYNSCELLVHGSLQALGTEEDKINFTSYATSPQANDWYGIRLRPNSVGKFNNCNVKYGYCGIEAISNDTLLVDSSLIESNQTYGINISQTQFAEIKESEFNGSVYGIKSTSTSPIIANNKFERNASYGIFLEETDDAMILKNYINGLSDAPTLYGIGLAEAGENVYVDSNRIEKWNQAGIYINKESYAQVNKDTIIDNTSYGILCSNSSSPKVRWCQIENNGTGVYCEGNAFPDLGTDTGYNSIDSNNDYYVVNTSETYENVYALNNWWGTEEPNPDKFIGLVKYNPWLSAPPEDGEQSAGIINTTYPFILYAPKPNPATKDVKIAYSLPSRCKTEFIIYNAAGQIMTKSVEEKEAGRYEYLWNSREFPNGVYIIRLRANDKFCTQKVVISK